MAKIGLFIDVSSLYYCIGKKYGGRKLDYAKYLDSVRLMGRIYRATAYGTHMSDEATSFIQKLKQLGYETKYKKPTQKEGRDIKYVDWSLGLSLDIVRNIQKIDMVILATANCDYAPIVEWVEEQGIKTIIYACGISRELKDVASQYIEIKDDLLEESNESKKVDVAEATK